MQHYLRHRSIRTALLWSVFVLGTTDAFAACDFINEYTDTFIWQVSDDNGIVRIEADGTAEGQGDDCGTIYIEVELRDPSGDVRHMRSCYCSHQTAYLETTNPSEEAGDWAAGLMTWENGSYIGCGNAVIDIQFKTSYWRNPVSDSIRCHYAILNCTAGTKATCIEGAVIMFGGDCPTYARAYYLYAEGNCFHIGVAHPVSGAGACT